MEDKKENRIKQTLYRFKDLTQLGSANIISTAISAVFWFYMAAILGTAHYGEVSYFVAISGLASSISFLGAGSALIVYTAKEIKIQSTLYFITIISGIISSIALFVLFHNIGVSVYVVGYIIFNLATAEILGRKLYKSYSTYLVSQRILLVIFAIGLYYVLGPQGVILGYAFSFFPYIFRIYKGFKDTKIDFSLLKPRVGFIVNSYLLDLSRVFSGSTDKLLVYPIFGFALLGNYQLGSQVLSLLGLIPSIVYQYTLPHDASGNTNKKLKKYTILTSIAIASLGIILAPIIIPTLFPKFKESVQIIQIMSLASIPMAVTLMYVSKFVGTEKNRIVLIGSGIFLAVQVSGIFIIGKILGINGVAISTVLAATVESIYLITIDKIVRKKEKDHETPHIQQDFNIDKNADNEVLINKNAGITKLLEPEKSKEINHSSKKIIISLLAIGFTALTIRLFLLTPTIPLTLDALKYFWYANDISILGHLPNWPLSNNGWPVFLSFFFSVFHSNNFLDYMLLQRTIGLSLSVLTLVPIYLLCNRFFGKWYAVIGATIFVFEPRVIQNSILGITEPLDVFLIACALFLFFSDKRKNIYISFGIAALAVLVRSEDIFLFLALSVMFLIRFKKEKKILLKYALAVCIFVLVLSPLVILRIQAMGSDQITDRLFAARDLTVSSLKNSSSHTGLNFEGPIEFLGWSLLPIFILFIPYGVFTVFKKRGYPNNTIITTSIIMLIPVFYAWIMAPDTRYILSLFPIFCILSLFSIKVIAEKWKNRKNIILFFITLGILVLSMGFLHYKHTDTQHEREALAIARYVNNSTIGINPYLPESSYLPITKLYEKQFPVISTSIPNSPTIIPTDGYTSLEEYIKFGKENGLTHLVIDDSKTRPHFLNEVFYNDNIPYLTKIYDSSDHGYKYHVKIYKIDYSKFDMLTVTKIVK
ncbi:MAG TPA: glycosyltransferase family 39 protein [Candidatus Nitrosotalea sp.]|nr:glycosyltransferase family 39 protein [Candidatus Nitrosotalea sp.]